MKGPGTSTMPNLYLDFETFSPTPITRGLDVYFNAAEPLLVQWALDNGPVHAEELTNGESLSAELTAALLDDSVTIVAHNAQFERRALRQFFNLRLRPSSFFCTMACAYAHSLPGALATLAEVLKVELKSDGGEGINTFCKLQPRSNVRLYPQDRPKEWARFIEYAKQDVVSGRAVYEALPKVNYKGVHKAIWDLDQKINDRGLPVDLELAHAAVAILKADKTAQDGRVQELTSGTVSAATQRDKLLQHMLEEYGVLVESFRSSELLDLLGSDERLDPAAEELIRLRLSGAMASPAKFSRLISSTGNGDRLRGTLQFCGASRTGRWAARIFQPHNIRRPKIAHEYVSKCVDLIKAGDLDTLTLFGEPREVCADVLRGLICAEEGRQLVVSDFSGIESRVLAWLAGEEWILDVAREADAGRGRDLYVHTIAKAYGLPLTDIDSALRRQGKYMVLSLGYEGGVKAFTTIAVASGVDLEELAVTAPKVMPAELLAEAEGTWDWAVKQRRTLGLSREVYVACEASKRAFRGTVPRIVNLWAQYLTAARAATKSPGQVFLAGRCAFKRTGNWLAVELPSGRKLMYPSPRVDEHGVLSYMGYANKQWKRIDTYGGKLTENITQAVARDLLAEAMLRADEAGYSIVLHVHDEIVCEESIEGHGLEELEGIMRKPPAWAEGLPLNTEGYTAKRYRK